MATTPSRYRPPRLNGPERDFARALRQVAKHVGALVQAFEPGRQEDLPTLTDMLRRYSDALQDWAVRTAGRMLSTVDKRDQSTWAEHSREMALSMREEIRNAPTGKVLQRLLSEQVTLIKSLPIEAAERVHRLTLQGLEDGTRAKEIAREIGRTGEVTANRAMLIARTEVARTASLLTEARAEAVGSVGYVWRTSRDSDVRQSHREMEGKFVRWDKPPALSDGTVTHAGRIYNCRCYPEPVLPDL
ncbi:MAG: minor capsid protein [Rhodospirillales bacterium]|nr:minor capsid protein [Rhodospirillales bacterium]